MKFCIHLAERDILLEIVWDEENEMEHWSFLLLNNLPHKNYHDIILLRFFLRSKLNIRTCKIRHQKRRIPKIIFFKGRFNISNPVIDLSCC